MKPSHKTSLEAQKRNPLFAPLCASLWQSLSWINQPSTPTPSINFRHESRDNYPSTARLDVSFCPFSWPPLSSFPWLASVVGDPVRSLSRHALFVSFCALSWQFPVPISLHQSRRQPENMNSTAENAKNAKNAEPEMEFLITDDTD